MEKEYYVYDKYAKENNGDIRSILLFREEEILHIMEELNRTDKDYLYRIPRLSEFKKDYKDLNLPKRGYAEKSSVYGSLEVHDRDDGLYFVETIHDYKRFSINDEDDQYASTFSYYSLVLIKEKRPAAKLKVRITIGNENKRIFKDVLFLNDIKIKTSGISVNGKNHFPKKSIEFVMEHSEREIEIYLNSGNTISIYIESKDRENIENYISLRDEDFIMIKDKFNSIVNLVMSETF